MSDDNPISRPAPVLWRVTCSDPDPKLSAGTPRRHKQAVRALDLILTRLYNDANDKAVKEDLSQGIAKVHALKPGQDTNDGITIIIPGRRFPVTWKIARA